MTDKPKKLYVDMPNWDPAIKEDDFIVAVGKTKSNSVYHVLESRASPKKDIRATRYHLLVYSSDLITALRRDKEQKLFTLTWYKR